MNKFVEFPILPHSSSLPIKSKRKQISRDLIEVIKPGILRSNLFSAFTGYWLASRRELEGATLLWMLLGVFFVMASACAWNNYIDRDIDRLMTRTKKRPLPSGRLTSKVVIRFAIVLGVLGLAILFLKISVIAGVLGLIGIVVYVFVYTLWLKRYSTWSTSIGAIAGAMPPMIGYVSVQETCDWGFWLLFMILFLWQPPHFWALSIYRLEDYKRANIPLLPVVKGIERTKKQMLPYIFMLLPTSILLYQLNYVGMFYLFISVLLALLWLVIVWISMLSTEDKYWARVNFMFSIIYLSATCLVLIMDTTRL